jgi:hypothetical protein
MFALELRFDLEDGVDSLGEDVGVLSQREPDGRVLRVVEDDVDLIAGVPVGVEDLAAANGIAAG